MMKHEWHRILVFAAVGLFLAGCARSPTVVWLDTCATYYETLRAVNDALELQTIEPSGSVAQGMKTTKIVLSPICKADAPPTEVSRAEIQAILDKQLIELIKIEKGIP